MLALSEKVGRAKLSLAWPGLPVLPDQTVGVGEMLERPRVRWPTQPGALYTILIGNQMKFFLKQ